MRTLLICHEEDELNRVGLAAWMASFSDPGGIVVLRETSERKKRRIRREMQRVGLLRFMDVLAFRVFYSVSAAARDRAWEQKTVADLRAKYSTAHAPELIAPAPNTPE